MSQNPTDIYPTPGELASANSYLSRCKPYLARLQRVRRRYITRIDYMPSKEALTILAARKDEATRDLGHRRCLATNSAVIDAIVLEWAALTGINNTEIAAIRTATKWGASDPQCTHVGAGCPNVGRLTEKIA